ncbi:MAG: hypothetical protein OEV73_09440 [Desulfobulbaceae bacterium]|nr:hypothetical protein [Desulfobulbaceae bacterium]
MSLFSFLKPKKIDDELVGTDEKVCSCSVRIADILQQSTEARDAEGNIRQTLRRLKAQPSPNEPQSE